MTTSLCDRIGGEAAVNLFYAKVLADPLTRPFFEGLDMGAQSKKQVAFMLGSEARLNSRVATSRERMPAS